MKAIGIVFVAIGVASLAAGGVFLAGLLRRVADARVVRKIPYQGGTLPQSGFLEVSTERLCQVSLVFHPDLRAFGDVDAREITREYGVEARVRVLDDAGKVLLREDFGYHSLGVSSNGLTGSVELSANTEKFAPPASGKIQVESTWTPRVSSRRTKSGELMVYDRVSDHTKAGVYTALFGVSGGVAMLLGAGLLFLHHFDRKSPGVEKSSKLNP
jgi:hypothetical protein